MRSKHVNKTFFETPNRVDGFSYSHSNYPLTRGGVSYISLPTLIISSEIQRGGKHKQPPTKVHIRPRSPLSVCRSYSKESL